MKQMDRYLVGLLLLLCPLAAMAGRKLLQRGEGMFTFSDPVASDIKPVEVHYYIPEEGDVADCPIVFVFQGNDRNYTYLMDAWGKEARKRHFIVLVPQFPMKHFPLHLYQEVGVMNKEHTRLTDRNKTTASMIDRMFEYVKSHTGTKRSDYEVYGHSAGGQFVQRFMMMHDSPYVSRAVVGSPGWYTFPDSTLDYSYGIKNVPYIDSVALKRWFNKDIVIQTADRDTVREWFLRKTPEADAQGRNRLERGKRFYEYCRQMAAVHHWPFRWREQTVKGVGHESVPMGMAALDIILQPVDAIVQTPTMGLGNGDSVASFHMVSNYLETLAKQSPSVAHCRTVGITPNGRTIMLLRIGEDKSGKKLRVWIQGGLHGNEPAPVDAVCLLADYLLHTVEGQALVKDLDITCLAVANPDGYDKLQRESGSGLDLNRDMTKMADPVTTVLKRAWLEFRPDVSFDIHEFNPRRKEVREFYGASLETDYDVLLMTSGHPNIHPALKRLQQYMFVPDMHKALTQNAYTYAPYFTPQVANGQMNANMEAKSPQSSSTWNALAGSVSLFAEIKGIGYGRKLFEKRVMVGFTLAKQVLSTSSDHKHEIVKATRVDVADCADSVAVAFHAKEKTVSYSFLNLSTGKVETKSMVGKDALDPQVDVCRKRPAAYLLKPNCQKAVGKLRQLGIEVRMLDKDETLNVEAYVPHHVKRQKKLWEGVHPVFMQVSVSSQTVKAKKGWFLVNARQKMADLIVTLLEPESANGYAAFEVLPVKEGNALPWFRVSRCFFP